MRPSPRLIAAVALADSARGVLRGRRAHDVPGRTGFRLVTANLLLTNRSAAAFARRLVTLDADVVCLQELTALNHEPLRPALEGYEFRQFAVRTDASGTGIWSRLPFAVEEPRGGRSDRDQQVLLDVAGEGVRLRSVHTEAPRSVAHARHWNEHLQALGQLAQLPGRLIIAGDFNACETHREFRRLRARGLADAHLAAGTGSGLTWGPLGFPPLLRLDHVLAKGLPLERAETVRVEGSDHRAIVVDIGRLATRSRR